MRTKLFQFFPRVSGKHFLWGSPTLCDAYYYSLETWQTVFIQRIKAGNTKQGGFFKFLMVLNFTETYGILHPHWICFFNFFIRGILMVQTKQHLNQLFQTLLTFSEIYANPVNFVFVWVPITGIRWWKFKNLCLIA